MKTNGPFLPAQRGFCQEPAGKIIAFTGSQLLNHLHHQHPFFLFNMYGIIAISFISVNHYKLF